MDENQTRRQSLLRILSHLGLSPSIARNLDEAQLMLQKTHNNGTPFSLLILDAEIKPLNGFEVAKALQDRGDIAMIPLIMLMSTTGQWVAQQRDIRINEVLTKPVFPDDLETAINRILASPKPASTTGKRVKQSQQHKACGYHILVAEDNIVNQKLTTYLLEKKGYTVEVVGDGQAVLSAWEKQTFDLILMDLQMPEIDGLQATSIIRKKEGKNQHLPIIAMTAHTMQGVRERCLEGGIDEYISKPIDPRQLFDVLDRFLHGASQHHLQVCTAASESQVFDLNELLTRVDDDRELVYELVQLFLEDCPQRIDTLQAALEHRDIEQLAQTAHTLKGSAGNICAQSLYEAARHLEMLARKGDLQTAPASFVKLQQEMSRLRMVFKEFMHTKDPKA
jgi:CheY-like chemotaxis protein